MDKTQIRDAATIIVLRDANTNPSVLMGQRGRDAAFMPGKFVFPGGAVDDNDAHVPVIPADELNSARLTEESSLSPDTLIAAAIRELWEETGQIIGTPGAWTHPPRGWRGFARTGNKPNGAALEFFFRAVTPKGRPRRFDARFFLTHATNLVTDPDDFMNAEDELAYLQWVPLADARSFDLPFITEVVLAELVTRIKREDPPSSVPFFRNDDEAHLIARLGGGPLL